MIMELDYETLLSPNPIPLSIGLKTIHLRRPTLRQIDEEITIHQFGLYEMFLKMTPELYYTKFLKEQGTELWSKFTEEERNDLTLYKCIVNDNDLQDIFVKILNFFFEETIIYYDGFFIILDDEVCINDINEEILKNDIYGVIQEDNFNDFLFLIQQTCCIYNKKNNEKVKFKNSLAKKLYEKMQRANAENEKRKAKDENEDLSIGNIISKVSNKHPTISPITVWDLTLFQLIDSFNFMQVNESYEISKLRVSVWGDENNVFDASLWYKNNYKN